MDAPIAHCVILSKLSHRLISIYTILYIKICYIERKYIHVYIVVGVPARVCIYVFKNMRQYIISRTLPNLSYCWIRLPEASITPIKSCAAWKGNSIIRSQAVNRLSFFHPISAGVLHTRHVSWRLTFLVQWYLKIVYSDLATKESLTVVNDDRSCYCAIWRRPWVLPRWGNYHANLHMDTQDQFSIKGLCKE